MQEDANGNTRVLSRLYAALVVAIAAIAVEVAAWILPLR